MLLIICAHHVNSNLDDRIARGPHHTNIYAVLARTDDVDGRDVRRAFKARLSQSILQPLAHYLIIVPFTHFGLSISYLYGGTATGTIISENGYVALRDRVDNTHEGIIRFRE